jgi:DNA-binding FadR family transcriptional regulator
MIAAMREFEQGPEEEFLRWDMQFHVVIAESTGNKAWAFLCRELLASLCTCRQHEAIHVAIGARDPDSERWRMSDHLRWSEDIIGAAIATTGGSTFKERRASWATGEGRLSDG